MDTGQSAELGQVITASWERCQREYNLVRDAARPILRLQSAEVAPRLEEMVERTGGRQGIIRQLAEIAANAGHCLVVTDTDGVSVRLEGNDRGLSLFAEKGIALGACWNERIAGTNGVSMALSEGKAFTVSGNNHYFSSLRSFACTAAPLFDADNQILGALNLAMLDRKNPTETQFAAQLLSAATDRIQRVLFERQFADSQIVSVSAASGRDLLKRDELVALNEAGVILGSTAGAHRLAGQATAASLKGKAFDLMFGADARTLERVPNRVMSIRPGDRSGDRSGDSPGNRPALTITPRTAPTRPVGRRARSAIQATAPTRHALKPQRLRLPPSLRQLAIGSDRMATLCSRAVTHYKNALPFLIEGGSGTGKSALVAALRATDPDQPTQALTVDCAALGDTPEDRTYVQTVLDEARISGRFDEEGHAPVTLVFDNVDELPGFAQAGLRALLAEVETGESHHAPRILATCRTPLRDMVETGRFRDDLYFLLAGTVVTLPALRARERVIDLAQHLVGEEVEITAEARDLIRSADWPGNVRELKNALQHALIEGDGRRITALDLRERVTVSQSPPPHPTRLHVAYDEETLIRDALNGARWNVSQAARTLGMGRATIHRKMKLYGIARPK